MSFELCFLCQLCEEMEPSRAYSPRPVVVNLELGESAAPITYDADAVTTSNILQRHAVYTSLNWTSLLCLQTASTAQTVRKNMRVRPLPTKIMWLCVKPCY